MKGVCSSDTIKILPLLASVFRINRYWLVICFLVTTQTSYLCAQTIPPFLASSYKYPYDLEDLAKQKKFQVSEYRYDEKLSDKGTYRIHTQYRSRKNTRDFQFSFNASDDASTCFFEQTFFRYKDSTFFQLNFEVELLDQFYPTLFIKTTDWDTTIIIHKKHTAIELLIPIFSYKNQKIQFYQTQTTMDTKSRFRFSKMKMRERLHSLQIQSPFPGRFHDRAIYEVGNMYDTKHDTVWLSVFELVQYDREKVDIYIDGKRIYRGYKIIQDAPRLPIVLHDNFTSIIIQSRRQGFPPPCTGTLSLIDSDKKTFIHNFAATRHRSYRYWILRNR